MEGDFVGRSLIRRQEAGTETETALAILGKSPKQSYCTGDQKIYKTIVYIALGRIPKWEYDPGRRVRTTPTDVLAYWLRNDGIGEKGAPRTLSRQRSGDADVGFGFANWLMAKN